MSLVVAAKKRPNIPLLLAIVAVLAATTYLLVVAFAPVLYLQFAVDQTKIVPAAVAVQDDRLYIPKIGLSIEYKTGDDSVLNTAAWHRYPERGNPQDGGNFILSGHRFELAPTPQETYRKSPFFGIDSINKGDSIVVDYHQKRYEYVVNRRYSVNPQQTSIEAPSDTSKLTIYSCTLGGAYDGREVIEALPL